VQREPGDETPDSVGEGFLTAAEIEQMLGNTREERAHLVQAHALFEAKGNLVRAQQASSRLRELGSG